jgi:hypothetical protein
MAINVLMVKMVLLSDGWHKVLGKTFDVVMHEYWRGRGEPLSHVCDGREAQWKESPTVVIRCPLSSVLAVKCLCGKHDDVNVEA